MKNVKDSNEYKKVNIENIVFLQGDDFSQYQEDSPSSDIEYLLQWYYPNEHSIDQYNARDINTPFLGRLIKIPGYKGYFLFSKNTRIGYIGLSRVVSFESL
jgi:hypothetical protein